ncbi:MAG: hypothetical protein KJ709_06025 [Nanoarchaeota archaeon]|nr:hypothetical protein [Nanoarchaeota archaeon]
MIEVLLLVVAVIILLAWVLIQRYRLRALKSVLKETVASKQSQSVKYGKMTEQFMALVESYPYDSQRFRFLGSPIDGVQFNDDEIIFMEFKVGKSRMTARQKEIKALVDGKKVRFEELRVSDKDAD